jgi:hypothetical protein
VNKLKLIINKIVAFYKWFIRLFQKRYTIHVSFDNQWGNGDDQVYEHVRKVIKANFKELKFRTDDKRVIHIRGMQGLRYKIEDE